MVIKMLKVYQDGYQQSQSDLKHALPMQGQNNLIVLSLSIMRCHQGLYLLREGNIIILLQSAADSLITAIL